MKCKKCGNNEFSANQIVKMAVWVDGDNNLTHRLGIREEGDCCGPYTCTNCGTSYENLEDDNSPLKKCCATCSHVGRSGGGFFAECLNRGFQINDEFSECCEDHSFE